MVSCIRVLQRFDKIETKDIPYDIVLKEENNCVFVAGGSSEGVESRLKAISILAPL